MRIESPSHRRTLGDASGIAVMHPVYMTAQAEPTTASACGGCAAAQAQTQALVAPAATGANPVATSAVAANGSAPAKKHDLLWAALFAFGFWYISKPRR